MNGHLVGILAKRLSNRPDAHVAALTKMRVEWDGIDAVKVELRDAPLVTRGPNTGRPNWRKSTNAQERIFLWDDLNAAAAEWSAETGLCIECTGEGRSLKSWHHTEGTHWKPCKTCNGTGSADGVTPAATRQESLFEPVA